MAFFSFFLAFTLLISTINVLVARNENIWINEIQYNSPDADTDDFLEIVAVNTINASNYELHFYSGLKNGQIKLSKCEYRKTYSLSNFTVNTVGKYSIYTKGYTDFLENKHEAIALTDISGTTIEFISYAFYGGLTAIDGIMENQTSEDIGAVNQIVPSYKSMQLKGIEGIKKLYWATDDPSRGGINQGQFLEGLADQERNDSDQNWITTVAVLSSLVVVFGLVFLLYKRNSKLVARTAARAIPVAGPISHYVSRVERVQTDAELDSDIEVTEAYRDSEAYRNLKLHARDMYDETLLDDDESDNDDKVYIKQDSNSIIANIL